MPRMCLALYIASDCPLPDLKVREYAQDVMSSPTWPREAQRFHTAALNEDQEVVRTHFDYAHVLYAGSYEGCGCGFNFGRQYPDLETDPEYFIASRESLAQLVQYVRESGVKEIYACWGGDEGVSTVHQRVVPPDTLASPDFFFREQELLKIE